MLNNDHHSVYIFMDRICTIYWYLKLTSICLTFEYNRPVTFYLRNLLLFNYLHLSQIRIYYDLRNYLSLLLTVLNLTKRCPVCLSFSCNRNGEYLGIFYCVFICWGWICVPVSSICYIVLSLEMISRGS